MAAGKRIFFVEDEVLIAMLLEDMLDELGCIVAGNVQSVKEAVAQLDAGPDVDAAILDVELSDGQSWPVAAALAARSVPFAFATGHGARAEIDPRFMDAPVLGKPYDLEALSTVLGQLLAAK
jgi:CheY-like chemotaxis protein